MKKGISLIALIITIIVIIILAVITIFGVNGVIEKAIEAKIAQEIATEKEWVSAATVQAKREINGFQEETLGKALDAFVGTGKTNVFTDSDKIAVQFQASERYYLVGKDGAVEGPIEKIVDEYAGDLTKGGKYDGTEAKPYQITCIEDLVAFSIMTNGGNSSLGLRSSNFNGKYVELARTLDFQSIFSYYDYTTEKYGDLNQDTIAENLQTELTKTEDGCIGFTPIVFYGTFDGKGNAILNLFENVTDRSGLFCGHMTTNLCVKNLEVTGEIISDNTAGGIAMDAFLVENCISKVNIKAKGSVGGLNNTNKTDTQVIHSQNYGNIEGGQYVFGINGRGVIEDCQNYGMIKGTAEVSGISHIAKVINCQNYGTITGTDGVGGINVEGSVRNSQNYGKVEGKQYVGGIAARGSVNRCVNYAKVIGDHYVGGIVGVNYYYSLDISDNVNYADVIANGTNGYAGGVIGGCLGGTKTQINCCNFGKVQGYFCGGIIGNSSVDNVKIINSYSVGELVNGTYKGEISGYGRDNTYIENCYWAEVNEIPICGYSKVQSINSTAYPLSFIKSQNFVDILNNYVASYNTEHGEEENFVELLSWKLDEKTGYPVLKYSNE